MRFKRIFLSILVLVLLMTLFALPASAAGQQTDGTNAATCFQCSTGYVRRLTSDTGWRQYTYKECEHTGPSSILDYLDFYEKREVEVYDRCDTCSYRKRISYNVSYQMRCGYYGKVYPGVR